MCASRLDDRDETLLALLRQAGELPCSGAEIGRALGISRAGVWKRIERLRQAGFQVEAIHRQGYRLVAESDFPSLERMQPHLAADALFNPHYLKLFSETDSTNRQLAQLARSGAPEGSLCCAEVQTQGRGRLQRSWYSAAGDNLTFSLLLRPEMAPGKASQITLLAGLALAESLRHTFQVGGLQLKWPNDILLHGRKCAGILTEMAAEPEQVEYVIVGVGINVNGDGSHFPEEIQQTATTIEMIKGSRISRSALLAHFLNRMGYWYQRYMAEGFEALRQPWLEHADIAGRRVRINLHKEQFEATAEALDEEGFLLVKRDGGERERVIAGDVALLS
uniref:Bifunctional ligase/repressor BirA n=1 Tax=Magnetococcus massalia (strain MO-1) TaxID=451514 RepID=A0A1S7LF38_MAGMO|nr:putative Biotin--acetyl-CoA-carboxylase ligase [Candidatus Magnetococcus massalia]